MQDAASWRDMVSKDKVTLRNLLIVILSSTALALLVGISCLGRVRQAPVTENVSVRSSAGGVPVATAPVGTTRITSSERERGASATGTPEVAPTQGPEPAPAEPPPAPSPAPPPPPPPPMRLHVFVAPPPEPARESTIVELDAGEPSPSDPSDAGAEAAIPLADAGAP